MDDGIVSYPHELEAERAVLGTILAWPEHFLAVAAELPVSRFYRHAHRRIYEAIHAVHERGEEIDLLTVMVELRNTGALEDVGGPAYLASLADGVPRTANVGHYAKIVSSAALRSDVMQAAQRILTRANAADLDDRGLLDFAQQQLLELADRGKASFRTAGEFIAEITPLLEAMAEGAPQRGVRTGFLDVDRIIPLLRPGNLVFVAGRPSMGKTAFALNLAQNVAMAQTATGEQQQVGFFSVEMSLEELGLRMVSSVSGVHASHIQQGTVDDDELKAMSEAFVTIAGSGLHIDDSPLLSLFDVRSKLRQLQARHALSLGIIDYLQLMETTKAENRNHEIAALARGLKLAAKELQIPLVVLSQLSREVERRAEKRPALSDLRDSGALEQDADIVLFVHRPEVYEPDKPELRGLAEIIIAKQRNGPTGTATLVWKKQEQRFVDRSFYDEA